MIKYVSSYYVKSHLIKFDFSQMEFGLGAVHSFVLDTTPHLNQVCCGL